MNRKELSGEQSQSNSIENWILDNAMQEVITLDTDATTANSIVPEGQIGFNPTSLKLFTTQGGNTYLIGTLTLV